MWPTPQDYNEAVQNPRQCFSERELMESQPELNALGLPRAISGAFASVYQMRGAGKQWAVRCFLQNVPDLENRYAAISDCLNATRLEYTVPFEFLARGIQIGGKWYPILKMQWVSGESLLDNIRQHLQDKDTLTHLLNEFREMTSTLPSHGIAHGDFQHGNILIEDRQIRLVDYDGMYVPALSGFASRELGHRHYQHPQRSSRHFGGYLDNFAAWSIYTSLYCLIQDDRLWARLDAGDECLLFRHEDYQNPTESIAFRYLEHHDSVVVREASRTLRALLSMTPEQVPPLGEPIIDRDNLPILTPPQLWLPGVASSPKGHSAHTEPSIRAAFRNSITAEAPPILRVVDEQQAEQPWYQTMPPAPKIPIKRVKPSPPGAPKTPPARSLPPSKKRKTPMLRGWAPLAAVWTLLILMMSGNAFFNAENKTASEAFYPAAPGGSRTLSRSKLPDTPVNFRGVQSLSVANPPTGPNWFSVGRDLYSKKKFFDARQAFSQARNARTTTFRERALCTYQIGRCEMRLGEYQAASANFSAAREAFDDQHKFVPSLLVDSAEAMIQLHRYSSAVDMLLDQIELCKQHSLSPSYTNPAVAGLRRASLGLLENKDSDGFAAYKQYLNIGNHGSGQSYADLRTVANKLEQQKDYAFAFDVRQVSLRMLRDRQTKPPTPADLRSFKIETLQAMVKNREAVGDTSGIKRIEPELEALRTQSP